MRSCDVFTKANRKFADYEIQMGKYAKQLRQASDEEFENLYVEVSEYQKEKMTEMLEQYKEKIGSDAIKTEIANIIDYAIDLSDSGSVISQMGKDEAEKVYDILCNEIGELLLDAELYPRHRLHTDGEWVVDVMFGGCYVPYWDGWRD